MVGFFRNLDLEEGECRLLEEAREEGSAGGWEGGRVHVSGPRENGKGRCCLVCGREIEGKYASLLRTWRPGWLDARCQAEP
jgi:hypothetical protein